MAHKLHLEGDILADLYENLRNPDALLCAQLPRHHRHYIQAIHMDTFFQMPGQPDRSRTLAGSRPGDSFADIVFGYLWARILRRFEQELDSLGILDDDLCVLFSADDSQSLVTKGGIIRGYSTGSLQRTWHDPLSRRS